MLEGGQEGTGFLKTEEKSILFSTAYLSSVRDLQSFPFLLTPKNLFPQFCQQFFIVKGWVMR
jgi:hypothetical protein